MGVVVKPFGCLLKGSHPKLPARRDKSVLRNKVLNIKCMMASVIFNNNKTGGMSSSRLSDL